MTTVKRRDEMVGQTMAAAISMRDLQQDVLAWSSGQQEVVEASTAVCEQLNRLLRALGYMEVEDRAPDQCRGCGGTGRDFGGDLGDPCRACGGTGYRLPRQVFDPSIMQRSG